MIYTAKKQKQKLIKKLANFQQKTNTKTVSQPT